jgi:hypothetical protein
MALPSSSSETAARIGEDALASAAGAGSHIGLQVLG